MAGFNNNLTLNQNSHTFEEFEDRLKAVTWDWQIDGDEAASMANLDKLRSAQAAYNAIRRDQGGLGKSYPGNPAYDVEVLQKVHDLWNKYAGMGYKLDEVEIPSLV
tara:strand:+ start:333 stop:650 length:318 start_codon:yes stop_codon:yes gene_type:complete